MKQLMIKQEFLDYIKAGIKDFEIRKDPNLEGKVELVSVETGEKLKVRLKLMNYSIFLIIKILSTCEEKYRKLYFENENVKGIERFEEKFKMFRSVVYFIKDYWKNGEELYWYNLEIAGKINE